MQSKRQLRHNKVTMHLCPHQLHLPRRRDARRSSWQLHVRRCLEIRKGSPKVITLLLIRHKETHHHDCDLASQRRRGHQSTSKYTIWRQQAQLNDMSHDPAMSSLVKAQAHPLTAATWQVTSSKDTCSWVLRSDLQITFQLEWYVHEKRKSKCYQRQKEVVQQGKGTTPTTRTSKTVLWCHFNNNLNELRR